MNSDGTTSRPCRDACGTMPSCAPLAVPYVPFQQQGSQKYSQADALANGTLFPGLNLPFHLKVEPGAFPDNHSTQLFRQYAQLAKEGKRRYEEMHGPLTKLSAGQDAAYRWLDDPWPWDYQQEGGAD